MNIADKAVEVTGGANGIGRALSKRFAAEGARAVLVADIDGAGAHALAQEIGGVGFETDVAREADLVRLVRHAEEKYDGIDLLCSNAGIIIKGGSGRRGSREGPGRGKIPDPPASRSGRIFSMSAGYAECVA